MGDKFSVWKKHFEDMARGLIPHEKEFYKVSSTDEKYRGDGNNITLISPPQQIVERAKNQLKRPSVIYDPVTGITHQSRARPQRVRKVVKKSSRKRIKSKKTKSHKKKKIGKKGRSKDRKKCHSKGKKKSCKSKKK